MQDAASAAQVPEKISAEAAAGVRPLDQPRQVRQNRRGFLGSRNLPGLQIWLPLGRRRGLSGRHHAQIRHQGCEGIGSNFGGCPACTPNMLEGQGQR